MRRLSVRVPRIVLLIACVGALVLTAQPAPAAHAAPGDNLALNRPATGSTPCNRHEGPEKAFNGSVSGGHRDKWCSRAESEVPAGRPRRQRLCHLVTIRHAGAGGESARLNTRDFDLLASRNGVDFTTLAQVRGNTASVTTHAVRGSGNFLRLDVITPTQGRDPAARVYELEVFGLLPPPPPPPEPPPPRNVALNKPATGSTPCSADEGPEKAFNGTVSGGISDRWCSTADSKFLQVDLQAVIPIQQFILRNASAGGESFLLNTRDYDIQVSTDGVSFTTAVEVRANLDGVRLHHLRVDARFVRLNVITTSFSGDPAARYTNWRSGPRLRDDPVT